jgi:hypothetical protein
MLTAVPQRSRLEGVGLDGIWCGVPRYSPSSRADRKRPISGESSSEAANQPPSTIAIDIVLVPKIARFADFAHGDGRRRALPEN